MAATVTSPAASGAAGARSKPIRILVVDDSVVIRRLVTQALSEEPGFEVVGVAANGVIALQKVPQVQPDVITLDIEMPEMDGLETLERVKKEYPKVRVVMFSTLTERGGKHTLEALSRGADDYVTKAANVGSLDTSLGRLRNELTPKIKQFFHMPSQAPSSAVPGPTPGPGAVKPRKPMASVPFAGQPEIVCVGVSTGGPNALAEVFPSLPANLSVPMVITQHMPPMFTRLLAERLEKRGNLRVKEAEEGDVLKAGEVLIAPGDYHLQFRRRGTDVIATLDQGPQENSCRPAVDVMFRSVADLYGGRCLAVILTGMGKDGLAGIERLKSEGARVLAQDRATSVVWGMPGYVVEAGLADVVAPIGEIAGRIVEMIPRGRTL